MLNTAVRRAFARPVALRVALARRPAVAALPSGSAVRGTQSKLGRHTKILDDDYTVRGVGQVAQTRD